MLRLGIHAVIVDTKRERGWVWYRSNWQTGASTESRMSSSVQRYSEHPKIEALQCRVQELNAAGQKGQQLVKGMPWKIALSQAEIASLQEYVKSVRRTKRSKMEAV